MISAAPIQWELQLAPTAASEANYLDN